MKKNNNQSLPKVGDLVGNLGKPVILRDLQIAGFAGGPGQAGQNINVITKISTTSDEAIFHTFAKSFDGVIQHHAKLNNTGVVLDKHNIILLVIRPDNVGELWLDTAAVCLNAILKESTQGGKVVFENDIADINGMSFPKVRIDVQDKVICIFREGWKFGFYCDFNPEENLSIVEMENSLGMLFKKLKYGRLFDAVSNSETGPALLEKGWFPFIEIIGQEYNELIGGIESGFNTERSVAKLISSFDDKRIEKLFTRWMDNPHFLGKKAILRSAMDSYLRGDSIALLKTLLSEIEGILSEAYKSQYGNSAKIDKLLTFAIKSAERKTTQTHSLFFPTEFLQYLKNHTFEKYNPNTGSGNASSRHAVTHGGAETDSYTQEKSLQVILTLDQIAFYT